MERDGQKAEACRDMRELAADILMQVLETKGTAQKTLNEALSACSDLSVRDRTFVTRLLNETLVHLMTIDEVINHFSRLKVSKLKPMIRTILRLAVCQLLYFDSVPHAAAVNEAVRLTEKRGLSGLKPYVNGVLRSIVRDDCQIRLPNPKTQPERYLSVCYSMPLWIVRKWTAAYGSAAAERVLQAMSEERPLTIRVNRSAIEPEELKEKLLEAGVSVSPDPYLSYAYQIRDYARLTELPGFAEGLFVIQDTASMLAAEVCRIHPGMQVLDLCAAPGGKTMHMADGGAFVTACDRTKQKLKLIRENLERCGLQQVQTELNDARKLRPEWEKRFDLVFCDVPCSGLGVMGRKYDIRYHLTPTQIANLTVIQKEILTTAMRYVKPGGYLLFSTCTINRDENEDNAALILRSSEFETVDLTDRLPAAFRIDAENCPGAGAGMRNGQLSILPGFFSCDGFFLSLFRRTEA